MEENNNEVAIEMPVLKGQEIAPEIPAEPVAVPPVSETPSTNAESIQMPVEMPAPVAEEVPAPVVETPVEPVLAPVVEPEIPNVVAPEIPVAPTEVNSVSEVPSQVVENTPIQQPVPPVVPEIPVAPVAPVLAPVAEPAVSAPAPEASPAVTPATPVSEPVAAPAAVPNPVAPSAPAASETPVAPVPAQTAPAEGEIKKASKKAQIIGTIVVLLITVLIVAWMVKRYFLI